MSGGGGSSDAAVPGSRGKLAVVRDFVDAQFLPLGLLLAIMVGLSFPAPGLWLGEQSFTKLAPAGIFLIGGMKLRTEEAKRAMRDVKAVTWGVLSILVVTCLIGTKLNSLVPLRVPEFSLGIAIFMCMPCTINSGAGLAAQAGGNFALALMLTVICSTLGVFTVPFMMERLLDFGGGITLPVGEMIQKLCLTVLAPIAIGKAIAASGPAAKAEIKTYGKPLTYLSNMFIIITPWIQLSRSSSRGVFQAVALSDTLAAVALGAAIHLVFLAVNFVGSKILGLSSDMCKSVVFVASGKTLPLCLTVLSILPAGIGDKGLIALPAILGHFSQIVMDSAIAASWKTPPKEEDQRRTLA